MLRNARRSILALGVLISAFAVPAVSRAGTSVLTTVINFSDYGDFVDELDIGSVPAGVYDVTVKSTTPLALFEIENFIYFSGSSYYPDGAYMGGDEGYDYYTAFDVDPQTLGTPYADTEVGVVPPTEVFDDYYYPGGPLESSYTHTTLGELLSLATDSGDGTAVVTFSAVPEPQAWLTMIASFFALGLVLRARSQTRCVSAA
jgi:hypothetical protein